MKTKTLLILSCLTILSSCCFAESTYEQEREEFKQHVDKKIDKFLEENEGYLFVNFIANERVLHLIPIKTIKIGSEDMNTRYYWDYFINKDPKKKEDTLKVYNKIDCIEQKITELQSNIYVKNVLLGSRNREYEANNTVYVVPGSGGERELDLVCNFENLSSQEREKYFLIMPKNPSDFLARAQDIILKLLKK